MIRDVIFDLDGTLIDSLPGIEKAITASWNQVFPGRPLPELRPLLGPPIGEIFLAIDPGLSTEQSKKLTAHYRQLYDSVGCLEAVPFPGCVAILRQLVTESRRLYIATNKPRKPTARILEHLQMASFFTRVISPDSQVPPFKNKGEMIGAIMVRHHLTCDTTVMVGDARDDGMSAGECGLRFVSARYGYGGVSTAQFSHGLFDLDAISHLPKELAGL